MVKRPILLTVLAKRNFTNPSGRKFVKGKKTTMRLSTATAKFALSPARRKITKKFVKVLSVKNKPVRKK
jgi:hypothetical protein